MATDTVPADTLTEPEQPKKNRPKNTKLRQQKLPAWQPILTATTVIPTVFFVGVIFIPIGIALFLASQGVQETFIKYGAQCDGNPTCSITIKLEKAYEGDVFFYYYLENFFQNHRRYVKSRNDNQYLGNLNTTDDCEPFTRINNVPIVPCGAVANSMFSDNFTLTSAKYGPVPMTSEGIVWDVDRDRKFKNPPGDGDLCSRFAGTVKPPNWTVPICELPGGLENVDFIIWMRTAALPNFRKLWRKLDRTQPNFENGLPEDDYTLTIANRFEVLTFNGEKGFVMSTTSWAGGKNNFLGIAYLVVGGIAVLLGVIFVAIHIRFGHSMTELSNIQGAE